MPMTREQIKLKTFKVLLEDATEQNFPPLYQEVLREQIERQELMVAVEEIVDNCGIQ